METVRAARVAAVLTLSLMLSSAVFAQGFGFGFGRGGGLLQRAEVQTELKLTDAQKTQVAEMQQKLAEEGRARFQGIQNATPEQQQKMIADAQAEASKRINAILNPDQQKRYKEISLQQQGPSALAASALADELKLTADQKSKIQEIMQQQRQAIMDIFQGAQGDMNAIRTKMTALRDSTNSKITALLTDEQKTHWTAMLGTPFNLPPPGAR